MNYLELIPIKIQILFLISTSISISYGLNMKNIENPPLSYFLMNVEDELYTLSIYFFTFILFFFKWYYPILFYTTFIMGGLLSGIMRLILSKINPYYNSNETISTLKPFSLILDFYIVYYLLNNITSISIYEYEVNVLLLFIIGFMIWLFYVLIINYKERKKQY